MFDGWIQDTRSLFVGGGVVSPFDFGWDTDFLTESLILAQDERWRRA